MSLYGYVRKGKDAPWKKAFPKQAARPKPKIPHLKPRSAPITRKTRIRPVSKVQARKNSRYSYRVGIFKAKNPWCKCCPIRGRAPWPTEDNHHRRGRGKYLMDETTWTPVCRECHSFIDANRKWAYDVGMLEQRI